MRVYLRTQAHLDQADGSMAGMVELEWIGGLARDAARRWRSLEGSTEVVMFEADFGMTG